MKQYSPQYLGKELLRSTPEVVDALVHLPQLLSDSARYIEKTINDQNERNPMAGIRSSIISGACIVGGVLAFTQDASPYMWVSLLIIGFLLSVFGK